MHRKLQFFLAAATVAAAMPARAQTEVPPAPGCGRSTIGLLAALAPATARVTVNGQCVLEVDATMEGKFGSIASPSDPLRYSLGNGNEFYLSASFNADPFVNFTFGSLLSFGGPFAFDVFFTTPVVGGPYNTISSNGSGTVNAIGGGTTGTVSHNAGGYAPAYISGYLDLAHQSVDLVGTSPCPAAVGPPAFCLTDAASDAIAPTSPASLTARLSYVHAKAGPGSSASGWVGGVELTTSAVPEPATVTLVITGVLVLGAVARRRRA